MRNFERKRNRIHESIHEEGKIGDEHVSTDVESKRIRRERLIREGKRVQEPFNTELIVNISEGFTNEERGDLTEPYTDTGHEDFRVIAWTDEKDKYKTEKVESLGGVPQFDERLVIPLEPPADKYLYVELLRKSCYKKDPGTSKGNAVMGRAKIRLPPWTNRKLKVDLVRLNGDGCVLFNGYLKLSMKLHKYRTS